MKRTALIAAAAFALAAATAAPAQDYREGIDDTPSAGAMAFDLLIARPVGVVATVAGVGLFVLNLPLSIIQGEPPAEPARRFIVQPARWTFQRPLGEMGE
jgi:hypothetical protein